MGYVQDIGRKLKGKGQKLKGEIQVRHGYPIQGAVSKIKGSLNEGIANANLRLKSR